MSKMKEYRLKYGKGEQSITLDENKVLQIIDAEPGAKITDLKQAVLDAIRNPVGSAPLREVVKAGDKVVILVSDITRAWTKTSQYLPVVVEELNNNGVPDEDISVIVAAGTHRANTDEEKKIILGEDLSRRLKVYDHDAYDMDKNMYLGTTKRGTPVYLDKRAVEADKVILTGGITPHLFAGFGGGRKSVLPGIAAAQTINHNHVMALSDTIGGGINPDTCLAKTWDNRVSDDMCDAAAMLNPCFLVNSIMDADGDFYAVVAGNWHDAWLEGTRIVLKQQNVKTKTKADIAITSGGGFPYDMNLYQGMKAYVPAAMSLKEGGVMIAVLECEDIAEPPVYFNCFHYDDLKEMEQDVRDGFTIPFYVAFYTCCLAERFTVILVTKPENFEKARKTRAVPVATLEEAMAMAEKIVGKDYTVNIIPHGMATIPVFD